MVSLALALGLADVIAHEVGGADLDTLFVDEGFGSLDADTLDDVMDTLDSLRDGGRVVGVVSHVAEMRDRIPVQLAGLEVPPRVDGRARRRRVASRADSPADRVDGPQVSTVPCSASYVSPVSFVFAKLISDATLPPGVSQYSPRSTSTRIRVAFGSSGPSGSHASAKVFHSSFSFSVSSTTVGLAGDGHPGVARRERHRHPRLLVDRAHVRGVAGRDEPQLRSRRPPPGGPSGTLVRPAEAERRHHRDRHVLHQLDQLLRVAVLVHVISLPLRWPSRTPLPQPRARRVARRKSGGAVG